MVTNEFICSTCSKCANCKYLKSVLRINQFKILGGSPNRVIVECKHYVKS